MTGKLPHLLPAKKGRRRHAGDETCGGRTHERGAPRNPCPFLQNDARTRLTDQLPSSTTYQENMSLPPTASSPASMATRLGIRRK